MVDGNDDQQVKPARFLRCWECRRIEHGYRITFLRLLLFPTLPGRRESSSTFNAALSRENLFLSLLSFFFLLLTLFLSLFIPSPIFFFFFFSFFFCTVTKLKEEDDIDNDRRRLRDTTFVSARRKEVVMQIAPRTFGHFLSQELNT